MINCVWEHMGPVAAFSLQPVLATEIPVTPDELFKFFGCLFFVLGAVRLVLGVLVDRKKLNAKPGEIPQPFETKTATRLATYDELQHLRGEFERFEKRWAADCQRLIASGEERATGIFKRINDVSESLNNKIHNLPIEIIELLRNTGALKK